MKTLAIKYLSAIFLVAFIPSLVFGFPRKTPPKPDQETLEFEKMVNQSTYANIKDDCKEWAEGEQNDDYRECLEKEWLNNLIPMVVSELKTKAILRKNKMKGFEGIGASKSNPRVSKKERAKNNRLNFSDIMLGLSKLETLDSVINAPEENLSDQVRSYLRKVHGKRNPTFTKAQNSCVGSQEFNYCMGSQINRIAQSLSIELLELIIVTSGRELAQL